MEALKKFQDKFDKNVPYLEITKVVLINCDIVNNDYWHDSGVSYTSAPDESFGQLLDVSAKIFIFINTFNSELLYIGVWFADRNYKPLEKKDKINITSVIN